MAVFASRKIVIPTSIVVTITGSGNSQYCYATINGTKQYSAGTYGVNAGDTITFGVYGDQNYYGWVKIDGTEVLKVTSGATQIYYWIVPDGISTVEITMKYNSAGSQPIYGRITVTTA